MKVLIAGGGIGGLVTALCLERAGIEARVFESASEIRPLGCRHQSLAALRAHPDKVGIG